MKGRESKGKKSNVQSAFAILDRVLSRRGISDGPVWVHVFSTSVPEHNV